MALDQRQLRDHLVNTGVITRRGLTRTTQVRHCPSGCGLALVAAQDMGHEIWCDPQPVTAKGELDALLAGRATYTRVMGELDHRDARRITFRSADDEEVFAEHVCGQPQPPPNPRFVKATTATDHTQPPPF